jgi:hypothetical protein
MSDHSIPSPADPVSGFAGLLEAVTAAIRAPSEVRIGPVYVFVPDLTTAEATTFADLVALHRTRDVELTPAEYATLKPDLEGLRTYHGLASPTAAQTAQATKAIIRVLRALLRD